MAKWLCGLAFLGKVATGIITSIPLALMQLLRCPHCRPCPGGFAAHPFMGVNARLLVLGLFGVFPAQSAPIRACAPLSSNSSESISLIALASAPAQTAVWPAFAANGTRPLVSAFLANLWACLTPSRAGSASSSETLPTLFFRQYPGSKQPCSAFGASPPRQVQCRHWRPLATHLNVRYGEDGARPLVSNVPTLKQRRTARNHAQAHNINISRCAMATAYHIASRDGDVNNNTAVTTSYVVNKQPLVRMCMSFILQKQCTQAHELLTHCVAQQ